MPCCKPQRDRDRAVACRDVRGATIFVRAQKNFADAVIWVSADGARVAESTDFYLEGLGRSSVR
jgi:hypothetical protein